MFVEDKKVGELNGKWSILFRAQLVILGVLTPFAISMAVWITVTLFSIRTDIAILSVKRDSLVLDVQKLFTSMERLRIEIDELKKKIDEQ